MLINKDFQEKVVVVTGAASGIGRATAIVFSKMGAKLCVADIDEEGLRGLIDEVKLSGGSICARKTDVASSTECDELIQFAVDSYGRVDVLFANAGISGARDRVGDISDESWNRVLGINLNGVFYCNRAAIGHMKKNGGVIINNASIDGLVGMGSLGHYTAAKHGVIGLTKAVALDHGADHIRCVAICPGYVSTNMTGQAFSEEESLAVIGSSPLKRAAGASEVGELVAWLSSDKASYITGTSFVIDGGLLSGFNMG